MRRRAQAKAAALGISLAEYVRRLIAEDLGDRKPKPNVSIMFDLGASDEPTDIGQVKDKLIGKAIWQSDVPKADISTVFDLVDQGTPTNIARDKDKMVGEAVWQDYLRKIRRKPRRARVAKGRR